MSDDLEGDLECTCDIGPFASCPVCRTRNISLPPTKPKRRFVRQNADAELEQRIAEIKAGYMK